MGVALVASLCLLVSAGSEGDGDLAWVSRTPYQRNHLPDTRLGKPAAGSGDDYSSYSLGNIEEFRRAQLVQG